jgi:hypothetical protein
MMRKCCDNCNQWARFSRPATKRHLLHEPASNSRTVGAQCQFILSQCNMHRGQCKEKADRTFEHECWRDVKRRTDLKKRMGQHRIPNVLSKDKYA